MNTNAKTWAQRFNVVCEVEGQLEQLDSLTQNVAVKVLKSMLHNYLMDGTTYVGKELLLRIRGDRDRKIIVNLHNDKTKHDKVIIRALSETDEITEQN